MAVPCAALQETVEGEAAVCLPPKLPSFGRLVVRYEYHLKNFLAMVQLGCILILLRRVLG